MNAVLFKAATTVKVTNFERDIVYGGETFKADQSLLAVDGPSGGSDFPGYSFAIACPAGSPQRTLFAGGSGPEAATITLVEAAFAEDDGALSWNKLWEFIGVLGQGQMVDGAYEGRIDHRFEYQFHTPPRRYWTKIEQQKRPSNSDDTGANHVALISPNILSNWRGSEMQNDD